jgi:Domain of unknown function (DUF5666)
VVRFDDSTGQVRPIDAAERISVAGNMPMHNAHRRFTVLSALLSAAVLLQACGKGSAASSNTADHIRGTIESLDGQVLTVATSTGSVRVQLAPSTRVATIVQTSRDQVRDGSFLGITSVTAPDGSQRAVEIHVFPESLRGTGEGSYDWDLPGAGASKMTNGAVTSKTTNGTVSASRMTNGTVTAGEGASSVTLVYKDGPSDGSQTITIPPDIPIVAIEPGETMDLTPGAHVFVVARRSADGVLTADRVMAGKDGVLPPM